MSWLERLKKSEGLLSRTEEELITYINQNPDKAVRLTLSELGEAASVSKPVIINCFRKLEYKDYRSMQNGVDSFFASQIDSFKASQNVYDRIKTPHELITEAVAVEIRSLERMEMSLDRHRLEDFIKDLNERSSLFIVGEGTGKYPADYLAQRLRRYGFQAQLLSQDHAHWLDNLHPAHTGDMVIIFHYNDDDIWLRKVLGYLDRRNISVTLISGTIHPDYVDKAKFFFHISRGELNFKNSMALPMHFAHLLLLTYEFHNEEHIKESLNQLEESRNQWGRGIK
ncbi:MurR/RpiR family transcriptional regulator [Spirochaeta cellobiosiphila]|uniref:MurR/RpiR family transcriptional regulator n=1 Tax=Spirochaeta cellobiosiphila TaxID=504483 RepID=UPI000400DFB7|nr:MurR/RpiR family transcriptional regulator [Spirochaeta cellobiosiphila]